MKDNEGNSIILEEGWEELALRIKRKDFHQRPIPFFLSSRNCLIACEEDSLQDVCISTKRLWKQKKFQPPENSRV